VGSGWRGVCLKGGVEPGRDNPARGLDPHDSWKEVRTRMTTDPEEPVFTILILARAPQLVPTSADSWLQRSRMVRETSGVPHAQNTLPGDGWYRLRRGLCQHYGIRGPCGWKPVRPGEGPEHLNVATIELQEVVNQPGIKTVTPR